jgi:hypothetical protein
MTDAPTHQAPMPDSPPKLARRASLGEFTPEVLAWLSDAFRRHVINGVELETAFRLDRASRIRARDDALRRAAALLTLGDELPWPVAGRLALAVARHQRMRGEPSTPLEAAIDAAFAAGVGVPSEQRQLYRIIGPTG